MNKQILIGIGVLVLALIGFLAYSQMNKGANIQEVAKQDVSSSKNSIKSLLTGGKNVTCTISYPDNKGSGTVYVAGSKVRGDFSMKVDNKEMMSHMIQDGLFAYMWSDDNKTGTKFKIDPNSPAPSATAGQTQDLDSQVDMKCNPWSEDKSKFSAPSDIQFMDMSQMMKNSGSGPMKPDSSVCDSIADATAKASCIKALGN